LHFDLKGPAVSTRKRRSRSADPGELHHRPASLLELDNYFQPKMSRGKSITKLVDSKDVTDPKVSRYTLTTQEQVKRALAFTFFIMNTKYSMFFILGFLR